MSNDQKKEVQRQLASVFILFVALSIYSMGLAMAAELPDALGAAERIDKLGPVGVLAFGFIVSMATIAYLIRCLFGRLLGMIDVCVKTMAEANQTMQEVNRAIQHCRDK